jgi:hypothetical protein
MFSVIFKTHIKKMFMRMESFEMQWKMIIDNTKDAILTQSISDAMQNALLYYFIRKGHKCNVYCRMVGHIGTLNAVVAV